MPYLAADAAMALVVATMIWTSAVSQNGTDCTNVIISMSPCLNYIQGNSTSTPASGCCTQLQTVVKSQPQCLCQVLNGGGSSLGLTINQTQALTLPHTCNVQTPPTSQCNGVAAPNGIPVSTPGSSNTVPSGRGATSSTSSNATSIKIAAHVLFFLVFVASYASKSS